MGYRIGTKIKYMSLDMKDEQLPEKDDKSVNNESTQIEAVSCTNESPEPYIPDESEIEIWEFDTLFEFEEPPDGYYYLVDDLSFELQIEVRQWLRKYTRFDCDPENPECRKYLLWHIILKLVDEYLSSKELFAIDYCMGTYASVCWPEERRKEICRNIYSVQDWFTKNKLDSDVLEKKILEMDLQIFYELTEILLKSKVIIYCLLDLEEPSYYRLLRNDFEFPDSFN